MTTAPTSQNASYAGILGKQEIAVGVFGRHARALFAFGTATPPPADSAYAVASTSDTTAIFHPPNTALTVAYRLSFSNNSVVGVSLPLGVGFFIFRDNADGAGEGTNRVKFYNLDGGDEPTRNFNDTVGAFNNAADTTGTITVAAADFAQPGSYKVVPVLWLLADQVHEDDTNPPKMSQVSASSSECYLDADNNVAASGGVGATPILTFRDFGRVAWIRVAMDVQSLEPSVAPQVYGQTPDVVYDLTAGTLNNPKRIRVGPTLPATATTAALTKQIGTSGLPPAICKCGQVWAGGSLPSTPPVPLALRGITGTTPEVVGRLAGVPAEKLDTCRTCGLSHLGEGPWPCD